MTENRLTGLRADLDVYVTFEGDNTVLLQLVGKRLLGDYAAEFKNIDVGGVARFIGTQAAEHSLYRSGLANVGRTIGEVLTPGLTERRIRSGRLQELLLSARVDTMVAELASNLRPASKLPKEEAAALLNENQHELIEAAKAYVELLKWQALNTAMHTFDDDPRRADEAKALRRIRDLYGLTLIERSIGWHIMYGRLSMNRARQVGPAVNRLCAKLAGNAADLVAAFGYGPEHRRATIAEGVEARRQTEAREHYRRARAQADHPVDEKVLHRERTRKG